MNKLKSILLIKVSFLLLPFSSTGAGIWTRSLDMEGVANFNSLHFQMASKEARLVEDLVTLREFQGQPLESISVILPSRNDKLSHDDGDFTISSFDRSEIKFQDSGDLIHPEILPSIGEPCATGEMSKAILGVCKEFKTRNLALAFLSAVNDKGKITSVEMLR